MDSKRKILIISYFFPPCNLVGAQRTFSWYTHFAKFGLYPVVITRHWNHEVKTLADASLPDQSKLKIEKQDWGEVHYLPYKGSIRDQFMLKNGNRFALLRKMLTLFEIIGLHLSFLLNPYRFFYLYIKQLCEKGEQFDLAIVSANPYPSFAVGYHLKQNLNIPWIADYRDDWTTNTRIDRSGFLKTIIAKVERRSEMRWLSNSICFTSVTEYYISKIKSLIAKPGHLVLNGFEKINTTQPKSITNQINLLFAGTVYEKQDFELLSIGLNTLKTRMPSLKISITFAGAAVDGKVPDPIEKMKISLNQINIHVLPRMGENQFAIHLDESDVLFIVPYGELKGEMPAKLFHYLSWGKPILMAGSDNDIMEKTLAPYSLAKICRNAEEVANALENIIKNMETQIRSEADINYITQFKRENQAAILADIIKQNIA